MENSSQMKIVIVYKRSGCSGCQRQFGRDDLLPSSKDTLVLKQSKKMMYELAQTVYLLEQRKRRKLGLHKMPKSWMLQIIKWSVGVNISRPLKEKRFRYACGHILHDECDTVLRQYGDTRVKKGLCPICKDLRATRSLTSITTRAVLRFR